MKNYKLAIAAVALAIVAGQQATQAGLANTGVSVNGVTYADNNWTVTTATGSATGGAYSGAAFLAENGGGSTSGFPFISPFWTPDNATSSWITYGTPLNNAPQAGASYVYSDMFTAAATSTLTLRWLSDNESSLSILDLNTSITTPIGFIPISGNSPLNVWSQFYTFSLVAGQQYDIMINVTNDPAINFGANPTGVRFEGSVSVPEPTTVVAGALMLLPFGIGAVRSLRKDRSA